MQKYIINIHSVVDVITNSSTELFLLESDKAVEVIREMVEEKEKEFPPEYGHYVHVSKADDYEIESAFGYHDDDEIITYLKAKGYTVIPPKEDKSFNGFISISSERGGMDSSLHNFIIETFNVVHHTTDV